MSTVTVRAADPGEEVIMLLLGVLVGGLPACDCGSPLAWPPDGWMCGRTERLVKTAPPGKKGEKP